MKKRIRNILSFICATIANAFVCYGVACLFYPKQYGRAWANFDIERKHYEVRYFSLTFMDDIYHIYFKEYGINYRRVAGCVVNTPIIESTKAYNRTMRNAISQDKGVDIEDVFELGKLPVTSDTDP